MIDLHGVSIAYDGTAVINGMSFNIAPGEIVALVGENGCGKSTLGRAICAAQLVDGGAVVVDGHDPSASELERLRVRELVGYVRQDPLDQIVSSLVFDEVAFGPRNLGIDEDEVARRVDEALELSLLHGFDQRVTTGLSGGEQQRLALAGVLAMRPRYLVLDEPTSQLDPRSRELMRGLFTALSHERGLGLVLITHDDDEIALADRVIVCDGSAACDSVRGEAHSGTEARIEAGLRVDVGRRDAGRTAGETVVSLDGVVFSHGGRTVLDGVDLDLHAGELVMLAGASGAGKSTLSYLAAGLLEPDAGTVRVCGRTATPGMVGVAFQQPEAQFFHDTVFDEVAFAPRNAGFDESEVRVLVERSIGAVGLPVDVLEHSPFELSGGQARRVAIASVIALDAPAYIFDEPSAALDAEGRSFIDSPVNSSMRDARCSLSRTICRSGSVLPTVCSCWRAVCFAQIVLRALRPVLPMPTSHRPSRGLLRVLRLLWGHLAVMWRVPCSPMSMRALRSRCSLSLRWASLPLPMRGSGASGSPRLRSRCSVRAWALAMFCAACGPSPSS